MNITRTRGGCPALALTVLAIAGTACQHRCAAAARRTEDGIDRTASIRQLGVGLYVWRLSSLGSPEEVARRAASVHAGSIYVKAADGSRTYNGEAAVYATARACGRRGIRTLVWTYTRATDPDREARTDIRLLHGCRAVRGIVLDIEDAVIRNRTGRNALAVLRAVRGHRDRCTRCRAKLVGAALPACPSKSPSIPTVSILAEADFISPMSYWGEQRLSVRASVRRMFREYLALERQTGRSTPLVPLGQACSAGTGARPGEIAEFARLTRGYYSVCFWNFERAASDGLIGEVRDAARMRADRQ